MVHKVSTKMRAMLLQSGLPTAFWPYALSHAVHVLNHLPHASLPDHKSPLLVAGRSTFPELLHPFGCRATLKKRNLTDAHVSAHGDFTIYLGVGVQQGQKGVYLYRPDNGSVTVAFDVIYDESLFPARLWDQRFHPYHTEQYHQAVEIGRAHV